MRSTEMPTALQCPILSEPKSAHLRVAMLLDYVWPSRASVFQTIAENVGDLRVICSQLRGADRRWEVEFGGLSVCVQKTLSLPGRWRYSTGVSETRSVEFPLDTLPLLHSLKPDVVISGQLGFRSLSAAIYRLVSRRSRLVLWLQMSEHQQMGHRPIRWVLRRLLLSVADHVITNGPSCTRYLLNYKYPSQRITEINTICDLAPFLVLQRNVDWQKLKRLVYVGRLVEGKGLLPFLDVLESVVRDLPGIQVEFSIIGYGPLEEELRQWKSGCERLHVRCLGFVDSRVHPEVYLQGDVFVFPTLSDEWGLVVNEALAAGLPIFGSTFSQAVECLVRDGANGFTFTPLMNDVGAKLKNLLMLSERDIRELGENGRVSISGLTPDHAASQFLDVIVACASTCPKSSTTGT